MKTRSTFLGAVIFLSLFSLSSRAAEQNEDSKQQQTPASRQDKPASQPAKPQSPKRPDLHIPRVSTPPRIDDYLNGKSRADELKITGFRQREPQDGVPVTQETTAYRGTAD
jgi:hypothetical protein